MNWSKTESPAPEIALLQFVRYLLGAVTLPVFLCRRVIAPLEEAACFFRAHDNGHRPLFAAFFGMDLIRRNQIDLSGTDFHIRRLPDIGVVGFRTVVETFIALDRLVSVKHTIQGPVMRMIVDLRPRLGI